MCSARNRANDSGDDRALPLPLGLRCLQGIDFPHKLGICDRIFGRRLARAGIGWISTAAGIPWKLDLRSATHRWIVYGKYEGPPFLDWARRHLPHDGVVVDSGANIGQMLLYLAQWVPRGNVFAFEPGREARAWLQECLVRNPALPVKVLPLALGARDSTAALRRVGGDEIHGACNQIMHGGNGEIIHVRRLADVLAAHRVSHVDLWKLDVEGYELMALAGAQDWLRDQRIRAIYVELAFGNGERIFEYLERFGYVGRLFDARGRLYKPRELPAHTNGLFTPSAHRPT
jgi:FkbM family methyltransferase